MSLLSERGELTQELPPRDVLVNLASFISRAGVSLVFSALGMAAGISFGAYLAVSKSLAGTSRNALFNLTLHVGVGAIAGLIGAHVLVVCLF